jgi:hypothetical protein
MPTIQNTPEFFNKNYSTHTSTLAMAIALAEQGMYPFPVYKNKAPACPHGLNDGTPNPDEVRKLFLKHPAPLIGVRTGITFDVLDIDTRNGGDKWLAKYVDKIPLTRLHQTRSGGWHYFFQTHKGLRNSHGRIAAGVDVLAGGGAVIWWPVAGLPVLSDAPIAPWPDWLLALTLPLPRPTTRACAVRLEDIGDAYIRAAMRRAVDAVTNAAEGTRNTVLNQQAWSLMRFAQSGGIGAQEIAASLYAAACAVGLDHREVVSTIASAIRARGLA